MILAAKGGLNFNKDYCLHSQNIANLVSTALGVFVFFFPFPSILNGTKQIFDSTLVFHLVFVGIYFSN